jgi:autotransporter-associated beta strand protein
VTGNGRGAAKGAILRRCIGAYGTTLGAIALLASLPIPARAGGIDNAGSATIVGNISNIGISGDSLTVPADGGGAGGGVSPVPGGAGGTGFTGAAGANGAGTAGGGGGAAGGGNGGNGGPVNPGSAAQGGGGGTALSPNGQNGNDATVASGGGGGGGGGGGFNGNGTGAATITNSAALSGGTGGNGGNGVNAGAGPAGGGGGGSGGFGAIVTGSGVSSNTSSISGGTGGNGGAGSGIGATSGGAVSGNGGDGGAGAVFTAAGARFTNSGTISGGNGGGGGNGNNGAAGGNGGNGGVGVQFTAGGTFINTGTVSGGAGGSLGGVSAAGIVGANLTVINSGTVQGGSGANAIIFTGGSNVLELQAGSTINGNVIGAGSDTLRLGGTTSSSFDVSAIGSSAQYQGFANFVKTGTSTWTLTNTTTAVTPWTINQGTLAISSDANLGAASGGLTFNGGTLQFLSGLSSARAITLNSGSGTIDTNGNNNTLSGGIGGNGGLTKIGSGILTLSGTSNYTGPTTVNGGTLQAGGAGVFAPLSTFTVAGGATLDLNSFAQSIGALAGAGDVTLGSATLTAGGNNASTIFSGTISGTGGLTKAGTGTMTLTGTNNYTGATTVNAGTLEVDGSIANSSGVTVNSGGTLSGTGTVDPGITTTTIMSGGTLAPGNAASPTGTLTIIGNLAFQSGALYVVAITPSNNARTNVSGTASLAGTVDAVFGPGSFAVRQYDILHSAGLGGTTFTGLAATNLPAGFDAGLSYSATDVFLNLNAQLGSSGGLNAGQQNVATSLNNFFNGGGTLPPAFLNVFGLSGGSLATALTQIDGEAATDARKGAFRLMDDFLGLMLDPSLDGRNGNGPAAQAAGFAPEQRESFPPDVAQAYAGVLKAPPPQTFDQRWKVWGTAFGGTSNIGGDPTIGSTKVTAHDYGFAAGMDYRLSPDTLVGFALSGGGTNWNLDQNLGGGRSAAFAAGAYGKTFFGPAYVAADIAFANHWFDTSRTAFAGDQLTAKFNGQSYGGRLEAGYRYAVTQTFGITPYAAGQAQAFHTPSYSETDASGGGLALGYGAMNATDARTELGSRFDGLTWLGTMPLILRARAAWAHDWASNPALTAVFQTLPGAAFVVDGATTPKDSALTSVGAELKLSANWSLAGKFDGEFASGAQTYAGTGTLRYQW